MAVNNKEWNSSTPGVNFAKCGYCHLGKPCILLETNCRWCCQSCFSELAIAIEILRRQANLLKTNKQQRTK